MPSIRDIQFFLFCAYAVGYPVAVVAPVLIDPLLQTHAQFGPRQYPLAPWCIPIYILLLITVGILFKKTPRISWLYWSILIAAAAFAISLPFFLPEFPHGNLFAVGSITLFLCALSVFVWSVCHRIAADTELLAPPGNAALDYLKAIFTFVRQGAFATVALFGALFFAAFAATFKYVEGIVSSKADIFLLNLNGSVQIFFYTTLCVMGPIRYCFLLNFAVIVKYREMALALDQIAAATNTADDESESG